jgi:hypothetical protein
MEAAVFRYCALNISPALRSAEGNNYLSCPAELLEIILFVSQLLLNGNDVLVQTPSKSTCGVEYSSILKRAQSFDAVSWATTL